MNKIKKNFKFSGFGFDIMIKNAIFSKLNGEEFLDLDMYELKYKTAHSILKSQHKIQGAHLKFLRSFIEKSYDELSSMIHVPSSTLRLWENKPSEKTGLTTTQEKAFRMYVCNTLFEIERNHLNLEITLTESFQNEPPPQLIIG